VLTRGSRGENGSFSINAHVSRARVGVYSRFRVRERSTVVPERGGCVPCRQNRRCALATIGSCAPDLAWATTEESSALRA